MRRHFANRFHSSKQSYIQKSLGFIVGSSHRDRFFRKDTPLHMPRPDQKAVLSQENQTVANLHVHNFTRGAIYLVSSIPSTKSSSQISQGGNLPTRSFCLSADVAALPNACNLFRLVKTIFAISAIGLENGDAYFISPELQLE